MRPVEKISCPQEKGMNRIYKRHSLAKVGLENNIGYYCSYCEVFSADLEVEHVISQHQHAALKCNWDNFYWHVADVMEGIIKRRKQLI
jgi:hypothetical protein